MSENKIKQLGVVSLNILGSKDYKLTELGNLFEETLNIDISEEISIDDVSVNIEVEPDLDAGRTNGSYNVIFSLSGEVKEETKEENNG